MDSQPKPSEHPVGVIPLFALASLMGLLRLSSPVWAGERQTQGDFSAEARHIISLVAKSGSKSLRYFASRNGILVVRRTADWTRTGKPLREANASAGQTDVQDYLYLGGLVPLVWVEVETEFSRRDLTGQSFEGIGAHFQHFVQSTRENFRLAEEYSLNMPDNWDRRLGPAAAGKLASNE